MSLCSGYVRSLTSDAKSKLRTSKVGEEGRWKLG